MNAFIGKKSMLALGLCMALNQVQAKEVAFTCQAEQPYAVVAFKERGTGDVLVSRRNGSDEKVVASRKGRLHVGFSAMTREAVAAFHAAGLAAGGEDNGGPGLRPYAANYFAAYIIDPDGHNIEAVCRAAD